MSVELRKYYLPFISASSKSIQIAAECECWLTACIHATMQMEKLHRQIVVELKVALLKIQNIIAKRAEGWEACFD
jgi:hypothetical protein